MIRVLLLLILTVVFFSCDNTSEEKCVVSPEIRIDLNFKSLEDSIPAIRTKKQLVKFFSTHRALRDIFFGRANYPNDSAFIKALFSKFSHPGFDTLLMETKKVFGDGRELKQEFQNAFSNLKYYYPDFKAPRIETVITGLETDIFVSDTLIIVGLDYYLGKKAKYRPNMYEYMLKRYEKNFIVPSALLLIGIDSKYDKVNMEDRTVLAEMVAYGKAYYFAKRMLPCMPDSAFIGYTQREIDGAKANQDVIWKRLVDDEALFSTHQKMKERYIKERPKVYEIGNECPGRIGMWVGWQIVNEYAKRNTKATLPELMQTADAQKFLRGSKYSTQVSQ
ncbi:gliding motility lipoprotein GldB [Cytophagales bacterium WSM2-2]|nr:gliding motility lipoprotein GldB [Cytophagales bacterium WSM2-2]